MFLGQSLFKAIFLVLCTSVAELLHFDAYPDQAVAPERENDAIPTPFPWLI
jgi:hypothetical protein